MVEYFAFSYNRPNTQAIKNSSVAFTVLRNSLTNSLRDWEANSGSAAAYRVSAIRKKQQADEPRLPEQKAATLTTTPR